MQTTDTNYTIYKGKLGYYVFTKNTKVAVLVYADHTWKAIESIDSDDPYWHWVASDAANAQPVTDLELLVITGASKEEIERRCMGTFNGAQE